MKELSGYRFEETGNDLTGIFVNDQDKEIILAMRGLSPSLDKRDAMQFPSMTAATAFQWNDPSFFGNEFENVKKILLDTYTKAKENHIGYNIILAGHSRG